MSTVVDRYLELSLPDRARESIIRMIFSTRHIGDLTNEEAQACSSKFLNFVKTQLNAIEGIESRLSAWNEFYESSPLMGKILGALSNFNSTDSFMDLIIREIGLEKGMSELDLMKTLHEAMTKVEALPKIPEIDNLLESEVWKVDLMITVLEMRGVK